MTIGETAEMAHVRRVPRAGKPFTDAEFEVVRGPYRAGDPHRKRRGWIFTGRYNEAGDPLFYNKRLDVIWYMGLAHKTALFVLGLILGSLTVLFVIAGIGYATGRYH